MKVFLDTNILLDVLIREGRLNYDSSLRVLNAAKLNSGINAFVSVQSLTDVAYVFTGKAGTDPADFYEPVKKLLSFMNLHTISAECAIASLDRLFPDFEDELQLRCAMEIPCTYFITGDRSILDKQPFSNITAIHPADFLSMAQKV